MKTLLVVPFFLIMFACPGGQPEQKARDTAAALGGALSAAQAQHQECKVDATPTVCQTISRGVAGQNALITSLETYCSWSTSAPPPDSTAQCVPVASAIDGLKAAISNANQLITEVKGTIKP